MGCLSQACHLPPQSTVMFKTDSKPYKRRLDWIRHPNNKPNDACDICWIPRLLCSSYKHVYMTGTAAAAAFRFLNAASASSSSCILAGESISRTLPFVWKVSAMTTRGQLERKGRTYRNLGVSNQFLPPLPRSLFQISVKKYLFTHHYALVSSQTNSIDS